MEFSIIRVLSLLKRDCILNGKVFILLAIALCALCAFIMFISTEEYCNSQSYLNITHIIFTSVILLGGTIFSNSIFTDFRDPMKRASYLSLPSSTFEKWLTKWILVFPVYLTLSFLLIYLTYKPVAYAIGLVWSECRFIPLSNTYGIGFKFTLMWTILFQSCAFILGIFFNKYAVFKSIAVVVILSILFSLGMTIFAKLTSFSRTIQVEPSLQILIFFVPILWLISYFLLKRKQI